MLRSVGLLSRLQDEVNELIPECAIHIGCEAPAWDEVSAVNIERLQEYLRLRYPEAGARYWRARGWGLLIWQPIYLAAHLSGSHCGAQMPNEVATHRDGTGLCYHWNSLRCFIQARRV
jgi:hypothetical protein